MSIIKKEELQKEIDYYEKVLLSCPNYDKSSLKPIILSKSNFLAFRYLSKRLMDKNEQFQLVKEINKMYKQVLINYIQLIRTFNLTTPSEMFGMFNFSYINGFLSKDHSFSEGDQSTKFYDVYSLDGTNVINGTAVCRHLSIMFRDLLRMQNIDSNILLVLLDPEKPRPELPFFVEPSIIIPDHAMTLCVQDNQCFILDTSNTDIYVPINSSKIKNKTGHEVEIAYYPLPFYETQHPSLIANKLLLPHMAIEEMEQDVIRTVLLCKKNMDIFNIFYGENKDIYNEISNKLLMLKK